MLLNITNSQHLNQEQKVDSLNLKVWQYFNACSIRMYMIICVVWQ